MLNHPTGLFSGYYNSALRGCWPLKFLHTLQLPKVYFKSYVGCRAASCWALPHISSFFSFHALRCISFSLSATVFTARCYAERGIATASHLSVRPSVCLSVTLRYRDHIGWNTSKIIWLLVSLGCSLFVDLNIKRNTLKFWPV